MQENSKNLSNCRIVKIISGGQTGADRGALEAAEQLGISIGGTAPFDYLTCNGKDPELGTRFHLTVLNKMPLNSMYVKRSCINVDDADKTIGYCLTGQWKLCINSINSYYRPIFVVSAIDKDNELALRTWLQENSFRILNVAGHRESSAPMYGFKNVVREFLYKVLQSLTIN